MSTAGKKLWFTIVTVFLLKVCTTKQVDCMNTVHIINKSSAVVEMADNARANGLKRWGLLCPFPWGAESPYNTMSPGPRPTSVASGILIHAAVWPQ